MSNRDNEFESILQERDRYKQLLNLSSDAIFIMDVQDGTLLENSLQVQNFWDTMKMK